MVKEHEIVAVEFADGRKLVVSVSTVGCVLWLAVIAAAIAAWGLM